MDEIGVTFEVKDGVRQLDGTRMREAMSDGWYWPYHEPEKWGEAHGPFKDCFAAGLDMARYAGVEGEKS